MAWRAWGKGEGAKGHAGMDNWEQLPSHPAALEWATTRVKRQLGRGYVHAPGSSEAYKKALELLKPPSSPPSDQAEPPPPDIPRSHPPGRRAYLPKLTNPRSGEVSAVAAILIALARAGAIDRAASSGSDETAEEGG
ncbi:MAG: hypothetical protein SGPRY_005945, partial [Prymnesium sp.]